MSEEDQEVRLMAARAIEFLSTHPNNKEIVATVLLHSHIQRSL